MYMQKGEKVIVEIGDFYDKCSGFFYFNMRKIEGIITTTIHNGCFLNTEVEIKDGKKYWVNFQRHIANPSIER